MHRRAAAARLAAACALALALALAFAPTRALAALPVVAACANPALPQAILDGTLPRPTRSTEPLRIVTVQGASVPLVLAVASDEEAQELGLMCVTHLAPRHGMLFAFAQPIEQQFWMKNTLIALDMVWIDADGTVTSVAAHVPASTRETPDDRVARRTGFGQYVIELRDGEAALDGIRTGSKLSIPTLDAGR